MVAEEQRGKEKKRDEKRRIKRKRGRGRREREWVEKGKGFAGNEKETKGRSVLPLALSVLVRGA